MARQEKAAKAGKAAAKKAAKIVEEAVTEVKAKRKRGELSSDEAGLAAKVKELRDGGMAWWAVGQQLQLKGYGDSARTGKGGAAQARRLYSSAFGSYPRKQRSRQAADETLAGAEGTRRRTRHGHEVVKATPGKPVFPDDISDDDIISAVAGKQIAWDIFVHNPVTGQPEFVMTDEQIVHEGMSITIYRDPDGFRVLHFREGVGNDLPQEMRGYAGKHRFVFVHKIVKVAGTGRRVQTEEVVEAREERKTVKKQRRQARRKKVSA